MEKREAPKWVNCEFCGKLTPDYLRTCFKCGKRRSAASTPSKSDEAPEQPAFKRPPGDTRPVGWWICAKCGSHEPPLGDWCLRCHTVRPGCEKPVPAPEPQPSKPETPKPKTNWSGILKQIIGWGTLLAAGLSIASFFIPALAPVAAAIKAILAALKGITIGD